MHSNIDSADNVYSIDESVREDMRIIKADPYLPKDLEVIGFVYDSFTGKVYEVEL